MKTDDNSANRSKVISHHDQSKKSLFEDEKRGRQVLIQNSLESPLQ